MATKKRDGVFKRAGSRFYQHRDPVTGRQTSTHCTDKEAALTYHRARERVAADPAQAAAAEAELGHWCDQCVALKRRDSSEATIRVYRQKLGMVLGVLGREFRLSDVTPSAIDRYVARRRSDGVTDHTIVKEFSALTQVLKLAKRAGCYPGDLSALRPLDLHTSYKPRTRALGREEVVRLLAQLEPKRGALVALTVGLGLRLSEAFRLTPADVDFELTRVFVGGTKTEGARRYLPILSVMRSLVYQGAQYLPLEPWGDVRRDLARACRRAGIERCTPNDLRRSHATMLVEAGVPRDVVRRLLGHTTTAMVDRVYGQPKPEALGALAEQVVGLLPPIETRQVCDSGAPGQVAQGASSGNRTPDLRFTKPLLGITDDAQKPAPSVDPAASESVGEREPAQECPGLPTSTRQCATAWRPDDPIWYSPTLGGARYPGVVDSEPWLLGGVTWVVRLRDMAPEYGVATGRPGRTTVAAAECELHVSRRDSPADRATSAALCPGRGESGESPGSLSSSSCTSPAGGLLYNRFDLAAAYARVLRRRAAA